MRSAAIECRYRIGGSRWPTCLTEQFAERRRPLLICWISQNRCGGFPQSLSAHLVAMEQDSYLKLLEPPRDQELVGGLRNHEQWNIRRESLIDAIHAAMRDEQRGALQHLNLWHKGLDDEIVGNGAQAMRVNLPASG